MIPAYGPVGAMGMVAGIAFGAIRHIIRGGLYGQIFCGGTALGVVASWAKAAWDAR